jgi:hypothetical protein
MPKRDKLSTIETKFRKQMATGDWQNWALYCESPFAEPPWRSEARQLALTRAASGNRAANEHARKIFDSELAPLEMDLHARRERARYEARGDTYDFELRELLRPIRWPQSLPPQVKLREEFVGYVLSEPVRPASKRNFVDARHARYVVLFDKVLKKQNFDSWLKDHKGLSRTQVTDYRAGRIRKKISPAKRSDIETAIRQSAKRLGL